MGDFIPFHKSYLTGKETVYIKKALATGKLSGDGAFTTACQALLEKRYGFKKAFLTSSCTDALEMCALLLDMQSGDEIIIPSYTFVSSANAFALRGAQIVFADSEATSPNIDVLKIEALITSKTKAIVCVHYAGMACDMKALMALANKYNLYVIEDAAHAIDGFYNNQPLGSFGQLSTFSFHQSKNITCGEGGLLVVNDERFLERAEIIRDKGTNRSKFMRGEIEKYEWVALGSSFLPSDITAAFLLAQLEQIDYIQLVRRKLWNAYYDMLEPLHDKGLIQIQQIPEYSSNNSHLFYIVCSSHQQRNALQHYLKENQIQASFHYQSLHQSKFFESKHDGRYLPNSEKYTNCLLRLPLFNELKIQEVTHICETIYQYFAKPIAL